MTHHGHRWSWSAALVAGVLVLAQGMPTLPKVGARPMTPPGPAPIGAMPKVGAAPMVPSAPAIEPLPPVGTTPTTFPPAGPGSAVP